jgi:NADPH-dependent 2,4-dienoyl-CoA reductase/sulfur reductase-like enzyme/nitrite reductase/ring-hydroxylating ferredoxin subunit
MVRGRVGDEPALLIRRGTEYFAVGAGCTHYHAELADGLIVDDTIRCPLHHACFSLCTGEALRAPALDPIATWRVQLASDRAFVRERQSHPERKAPSRPAIASGAPLSIVIVGAGAAGVAAADMIRREGYSGPVTMISAEDVAPYDRPNLSKDYLTGAAPESWMPLRSPQYYEDRRIDLLLNQRVTAIDTNIRAVHLADGRLIAYGALLLATGAEPVHLPVPMTAGSPIFYLRTLADSRSIIKAAAAGKTAVVVGASFIGLEVAAALRTRGLSVHVVGLESVLFERVLGATVGTFLRSLHESHGISFHLQSTVVSVDGNRVALRDGTTLTGDLVVFGVGVAPELALAEQAGLQIDRGVVVNEFLETNVAGVFAAGDIARWPDPHSGDRIRVEHWVVAERQGQCAAHNMLGDRKAFAAVPFFWSQHYDVTINYVGHAERWDSADLDGALESHDCTVTYRRGGLTLAVATIARDRQSLQAELDLESTRAKGA